MQFNELIPVLQVAIGPVILISGVGLLLLTMTNRYGRVIDRARQICAAMRTAPATERATLASQLEVLFLRARVVRTCITLASISVLLAALLIIALFFIALLKLEWTGVVVVLFVGCMAALIASLALFLRDMNLSLGALHVEMKSATAR